MGLWLDLNSPTCFSLLDTVSAIGPECTLGMPNHRASPRSLPANGRRKMVFVISLSLRHEGDPARTVGTNMLSSELYYGLCLYVWEYLVEPGQACCQGEWSARLVLAWSSSRLKRSCKWVCGSPTSLTAVLLTSQSQDWMGWSVRAIAIGLEGGTSPWQPADLKLRLTKSAKLLGHGLLHTSYWYSALVWPLQKRVSWLLYSSVLLLIQLYISIQAISVYLITKH